MIARCTRHRLALLVEPDGSRWRATLRTTDGSERSWSATGKSASHALTLAEQRFDVDDEIARAADEGRAARPLVGMPCTMSVNGDRYPGRVDYAEQNFVRCSFPHDAMRNFFFTRRKDGSWLERGVKLGQAGRVVRFGVATHSVAREG